MQAVEQPGIDSVTFLVQNPCPNAGEITNVTERVLPNQQHEKIKWDESVPQEIYGGQADTDYPVYV